MVLDQEKADLEASQHVPQEVDGPLQHPTVSTTEDGESDKQETASHLSIHEHSSIQPVPENSEPLERAKSKTISIQSRPLSVIPRHRRRGLFARFTLVPEVARPYDYKNSTKWFITFLVALAAAVCLFCIRIWNFEGVKIYNAPGVRLIHRLPRQSRLPYVSNEFENNSKGDEVQEFFMNNGSVFRIIYSGFVGQLTSVLAVCCELMHPLAAPMGSAILLPALPQLAVDLHTTTTITNLSVAMYMLSMSIFPLWWSSFSETLGRRSIYLTSFALFTFWNIIAGISTSISMLIVMRILSGGAAASVQAVGAGTIADVWEVRERGRAMGIFYLGPLLGPLLAPIIGGALSQAWGWRSTQWFQVIYGGLLWVFLLLCLPETLAKKTPPNTVPQSAAENSTIQPELSRISTRQSIQIKSKKVAKVFKRCFIDPLAVLGYLRFPAVLITVYLASITFGSLYMLNISIQQTFSSAPYSFHVIILGLLYIPNSIGYVMASVVGGRYCDYVMHREAKVAGRYDEAGKLILLPEDRMRENAWVAAVMFPGALIWYGWTVEKGIIWIVPMIANFFFGLGSMTIFGLATTMLTEFLPKRSSSGVAVNNFVRNIFSCVGGVIAQPLISAIGNGWLFAGLGVICLISAVSVVKAMRTMGPRWRVKMNEELGIK